MQSKPNAFERFLESAIFASRWLLAPFFLGLIIAMAVLLLKFGKELPDQEDDSAARTACSGHGPA
jgi:uncharacterized membrane protein YqhA